MLLAHPQQSLAAHLMGVANRAAGFARFFSAEEHGKLAGLLHDLGKAEEAFQTRMKAIAAGKKDPADKQPHAHHGAALALAQDHWPVGFVVNGHHAGLHDRHNLDSMRGKRAYYAVRARDWCLAELKREGFKELPEKFGPLLPKCFEDLADDLKQQMHAVELYTRFLFSALIDADRLDTEQSDPKAKAAVAKRKRWRSFDPEALVKQLEDHLTRKRKALDSLTGAEKLVQIVRDEVGDCCRTSDVHNQRGIFTLTLPTGGGKTLASMLFALNHALRHNQRAPRKDGIEWQPIRRIIVVIPYLNIIQQTTATLNDVFKHTENDPVVLEHHSQAQDPPLDEQKVDRGKASDYSYERTLRQLAAENWDAPIVVTTSVQFFDSLFSRRTADARKLHNIAQSVIIFDEVQTFPPHLLPPILNVLSELTHPGRPYGCSAVFCTATQPALEWDEVEFPIGLKTTPIIPSEKAVEHFCQLQRVRYSGLRQESEPETLHEKQLAEKVLDKKRQQSLVVVNTRPSARRVFAELQAKAANLRNAVFHLSTWMTPTHRIQVLEEVRRRLRENAPCLLVSTQCIEAGVDVDFPEVWRAYGPYDSIVQAAGRCNREGKLVKGDVHVFHLQDDDPRKRKDVYGVATTQTDLLRRMNRAHPEDPTTFSDYFRLLYQISVPDECLIQEHRAQLRFEEASNLFRFIEDNTFPVLVREFVENGQQRRTDSAPIYADAECRSFFTRDDWRLFQRDIINLPYYTLDDLLTQRVITPALRGSDKSLYVFTGDAYYEGGLNAGGFQSTPSYSERSIA